MGKNRYTGDTEQAEGSRRKEVTMLQYQSCRLCPRQCGVDRTRGETGFCKMPGALRAARAAAHYWEEPVISGSFGSGTVFFSGCTLGCGFCQNEPISHGGVGREITPVQLRALFEKLIDEGVQNINLVTPTHFLPSILPALQPKLPVPVVYNCGGYESVETLRQLEGLVDIYLPDFKYADAALAAKLSRAPDYPTAARSAILEMYRQTGPYVLEDEQMVRGVLIRHLILPGQIDNSLGVLDWIGENFRPGQVLFSLMSQYVPMGQAAEEPPFDRRITALEYDAVRSWMELCGITDGFTQDFSAASAAYIPPFVPEELLNF